MVESGADDFLSKPCREDELLEKMSVLLNVQYAYEETSETTNQPPTGVKVLTAETFALLPLHLVEELCDATSRGNKRQLDELIQKVRDTQDAAFSNALQELADKYQYDTLTRMLEEACRR